MDDGLLERDRELAALERLIEGARDEGGRVVLIEGPAGIGKTRLLAAARERAARGMTVLTARCSELEREFSFGAVRQLFEPVARDAERRARLLAGAAAPVEGVLGAPEGDAEGTFAVLHGLYWATLNLAEEQPVLIAIDDLQWSDRPSLRFIAYLAARLEGAPVLVAASVRSTDPGTDPQLLAEIAADPLTVAVRPGPLGEASVRELIHGRLGDADPAFTEACLEATGGNPLLLRHVLIALEQDGVRPTAAGAAAVRGIGSRAVSRTVLLRLSRLREEAAAVARAVAVLGESSKLPAVAALTGLDEDAVARAAGELARADILRPEAPLGFVHPLVRDAVYHDVPAGERELLHGRAADVLARARPSARRRPATTSPTGPTCGGTRWRRSCSLEGRPAEALEQAELMGRSAPHVLHPDWKPWQSLKARALAQLGRPDEAIAAMEAELALARGVGGRRVIGRCLRQLAELEGDAGEPRLHEAIELLSTTPGRLELARALAALGGLLRRTRRPTEAREPLRRALELAEACGCPPLVESVRSELYATGARPRTTALAGVESLTARELRVATLAADGQTNREIAQALYVTPKTVEVHLSSAYRKLDIRSRRDLVGALGSG